MAGRADGIRGQLDRSIYSDDPDAIPALEARLAELEAERARIKAFNASCRKGSPDWSILTPAEQSHHRRTLELAGWQCKGGAFPAYALSNLSGNIKRNRDRLAELQRRAEAEAVVEALAGVDEDDHGAGCDGPGNCVCSAEAEELIDCDAARCRARFFFVAAREFPRLCFDHSDEASRLAHGWTRENSL